MKRNIFKRYSDSNMESHLNDSSSFFFSQIEINEDEPSYIRDKPQRPYRHNEALIHDREENNIDSFCLFSDFIKESNQFSIDCILEEDRRETTTTAKRPDFNKKETENRFMNDHKSIKSFDSKQTSEFELSFIK